MPVVDAYGDRRFQDVMDGTWGHLRANPHRAYSGTVTFAEGCFNVGTVIIDYDFGDLPDSPWLMAHLQETVDEWVDFLVGEGEFKQGTVYRWAGIYRFSKAGGPRFDGEFDHLKGR